MNLQAIEYTRIEVRRALANLSEGTKGQLQAFSEHPPADKNKTPRCGQPLIELEGGGGCGRSLVRALTTPFYVLETRSRRRPLPPMQDLEFSYAPWRRVINSLDDYQQAWIRYCYGFDLNFRYQTLMCQHVWNGFQNCRIEKKLQSRVVKKLVSLVWLAAQEVAAARSNDTYKEYAGAALARMISVNRSTWLRVYASHWARFKAAFVELDAQALQTILIRREAMDVANALEM
ncbi:bacteriophage antitermination protein Q [Citrobacter sp. Cs237]|uniref:bacteriophage antitermination protein Q n=1 Tax=Citrobacter TaxID=544 RepID=UPI0015EA43EC|nr:MULTISPECIES: bacteriophage antitermination protein Q [Citrobacter]EHG7584042.1 antitermination protein [Citrobacter sedlakii]EHG7613691.1 antitermination protein [Citrobacter sedlakii]EIQ7159994.1 antitermination protein [Citrobacter sedlakii]MBN6599932.1 antitermination protein [Citrobacter sedlakii]MDM2750259.1 bacteriophage antitermination protein Q [Citrobacter sp. Cs237]